MAANISDDEVVLMTGTSDPPEYSVEDWDCSPISAHFEESQTSDIPFPSFLTNNFPEQFVPGSLLVCGRSSLMDRMATPPATKVLTYNVQREERTWAELGVKVDETMSKNTPTFIEGSQIEGWVSLYAARAESINSVVVSIRGQVIIGTRTSERLTFFEVAQTIWSKSMGNPRKVNCTADMNPSSLSPYTEKLRGTFSWPFSLEMPREVVISSQMMKGGPCVFRPPESFFERHGRASVRYESCVRFVRGHFRPDDRIYAEFKYVPNLIPGPPSPLRRLAYEQGTALLGPTMDPAGWHECRTIKLTGRIQRLRNVEVYCTLYLAKPLVYTRGAVIPCWLRLHSWDMEALDVIATPKSIVTRLRRCVRITADQAKAVSSPSWRDQVELSELGIWWPASESANVREMSGELHLNIGMKPSSAMAHFRIEYNVVLFPFDSTTFETVVTAPLIEEPVEIVTGYAPGPKPRMYAPPEYETPDTVFVESRLHTQMARGLV